MADAPQSPGTPNFESALKRLEEIVKKLESGELFSIGRGNATVAPRKAALQVALDAEETALRYYSQLVERTNDRNLRSIYAELANFEADHTEFLRRKLNDAKRAITGGDVV